MPMAQEKHKKVVTCKILDQNALHEEMSEIINEIAQMVELSHGTIRILLNRYKWDKDHLMERFYDSDDVDEFLRRARVDVDQASMGDGVDGEEQECAICCNIEVLTGPKCRHYACKKCWEQYLTSKVLIENTSSIECIYPGCTLLQEEEHVVAHIGRDEAAHRTFIRLSINCFVASNRRLRWCPAVDCGMAIKVRDFYELSVECACGCRFCFECGSEWHEPVDCKMLKLWKKKCEEVEKQSETCNWIDANTKDCPKCKASRLRIENIGETALCMQSWKVHGYDKWCNVFDYTTVEILASLERYLHYYKRFVNHDKSRKLETNLYDSIKRQQAEMPWIDMQFLNQAVDCLVKCRQTLMYTYVFAFYIKKSNAWMIFEANQRDLEMATEQLSVFLEIDMDMENEEDVGALKRKVQDAYRCLERRRNALLNQCAEGVESEKWRSVNNQFLP